MFLIGLMRSLIFPFPSLKIHNSCELLVTDNAYNDEMGKRHLLRKRRPNQNVLSFYHFELNFKRINIVLLVLEISLEEMQQLVVQQFLRTVRRDEGRYTIKLPWLKEHEILKEN